MVSASDFYPACFSKSILNLRWLSLILQLTVWLSKFITEILIRVFYSLASSKNIFKRCLFSAWRLSVALFQERMRTFKISCKIILVPPVSRNSWAIWLNKCQFWVVRNGALYFPESNVAVSLKAMMLVQSFSSSFSVQPEASCFQFKVSERSKYFGKKLVMFAVTLFAQNVFTTAAKNGETWSSFSQSEVSSLSIRPSSRKCPDKCFKDSPFEKLTFNWNPGESSLTLLRKRFTLCETRFCLCLQGFGAPRFDSSAIVVFSLQGLECL